MKKVKLMKGNNIELLKKLPDNSIDSIVSDPPYGLSFMNKKWDYDVPSVEFWKEVYRVLKPGGHILSFGGTRTYHRMVVNIEDAGFEIRDQIMWLYGSGFPKSHNIGKAVDKIEGNEREVVGTQKQHNIKGDKLNYSTIHDKPEYEELELTKGTSPYEGWGTALKPANEPICVARKPLSEKSVAENVLKWGTGGINIDGCRIETTDNLTRDCLGLASADNEGWYRPCHDTATKQVFGSTEGRFPANIILDETAAELLDEQSGISKPKKERTGRKGGTNESDFSKAISSDPDFIGHWPGDNGGGASRFFYIPKVSKKERNMGLDHFEEKETKSIGSTYAGNQITSKIGGNPDKPTEPKKNSHPTVKPVQLMAYLCRLITPANGIVLDPYMGSGSTGIAALLEGFRFCGMEMDEDYFKIAEARIENYENYREFVDKKKK